MPVIVKVCVPAGVFELVCTDKVEENVGLLDGGVNKYVMPVMGGEQLKETD